MMWRWLLAAKLFLCEIICLSPAVAVIYTYTKKYVLINIITLNWSWNGLRLELEGPGLILGPQYIHQLPDTTRA